MKVRGFKRPIQKLFGSTFAAASLLAALLALLAQTPASALDLSNSRTAGHVAVPGVNAHFIPAPELTLASGFDGFESKKRKIEVIVAYIEAPIEKIEEGFTDASFKSRGMDLKSSGDFTVNGERAVLYKVLHGDGAATWGKWVMLAGNGPGTLVVNAVFVSGDAAAASDLEKMLKGVYMEPRREEPASQGDGLVSGGGAVSGDVASGDVAASGDAAPNGVTSRDAIREGVTSRDSARTGAASGDSRAGSVSSDARPMTNSERVRAMLQPGEAQASGDKRESDSALALGAVTPRGTVSGDKRGAASGDVSPDSAPQRRGAARIITEEGVISGLAASGDIKERARPASGDVASGDRPPE
jgi:hypothetical protein